jgi:HK97 family phage major capsid protein
MNQSKRLQELRAQRAQIGNDLRKLVDDHPGDKWTADCTANYDNALAGIDKLDGEIGRIEKALKVSDAIGTSLDKRAGEQGISDLRAQDEAGRDMAAFVAWCKYGMDIPDEDLRAVARSKYGPVQGAGVGTGAAGGFTVPQEFLSVLETALRAYGGVRQVATVIRTDSGADMPMATNNDTAAAGVILTENTAAATADVTFGQVILRAFMYSSGIVPVSFQLLQDTAFDMGTWLAMQLAHRLGRIENQHFTTGTGTTAQPQGIANASVGATIGHTQPTGAANVTGYNYTSLVTMEHSVDPAYRANGARWMMSDTALRQVRLILDSQNRPLFVPGYTIGNDAVGGAPDTLMGYRIVINQDMPVPAANARSIAFGDFSRYYVREVQGVQVMRLNERFADALQVAFLGYQRVDGRIVDAGTNPFRLLQNSAS